jgi:hypothetical protein
VGSKHDIQPGAPVMTSAYATLDGAYVRRWMLSTARNAQKGEWLCKLPLLGFTANVGTEGAMRDFLFWTLFDHCDRFAQISLSFSWNTFLCSPMTM